MPLTADEEARRLAPLFRDNPVGLMTFLSSQLAVLKTQAQVFTGLSTITITVTGFSGHNMVRGGLLSTAAMVLGMGLVLAGIAHTLRTLRKLRWVSQELDDDLLTTALAVITRRDEEQRALGRAGVLVVAGLASYLVAVVLAAIAMGGRYAPPS
jgi:hypothetical protein